MRPSLSVISVYYNRRQGVEASVRSILHQDYPPDEIILVDDGSTDGTRQALEQIKDPRVRVIGHKNTGFTNAVKRAVQISAGELVAIQGSGDISHPARLRRQVSYISANPAVAAVGVGHRDVCAKTGRVLENRTGPSGQLSHSQLRLRPPFTHGTALFRRAAYDAVGGYDPRFTYCQDWDLWLRLGRLASLTCIDDVLYDRIVQPDGASFSPKKAINQLAYKHLALHADAIENASRDDFIRQATASDPLAIDVIRKAVAEDAARRAIKLTLLGHSEDAQQIFVEMQQRGYPLRSITLYVTRLLGSIKFKRQILQIIRSTDTLSRHIKKVA